MGNSSEASWPDISMARQMSSNELFSCGMRKRNLSFIYKANYDKAKDARRELIFGRRRSVIKSSEHLSNQFAIYFCD